MISLSVLDCRWTLQRPSTLLHPRNPLTKGMLGEHERRFINDITLLGRFNKKVCLCNAVKLGSILLLFGHFSMGFGVRESIWKNFDPVWFLIFYSVFQLFLPVLNFLSKFGFHSTFNDCSFFFNFFENFFFSYFFAPVMFAFFLTVH